MSFPKRVVEQAPVIPGMARVASISLGGQKTPLETLQITHLIQLNQCVQQLADFSYFASETFNGIETSSPFSIL